MALADVIVTIGADLTGFNGRLDEAQRSLNAAAGRMENVGKVMTSGLTVPIVAVGSAALGAAVHVGSLADELLDLVDQTGLSAATLQEFRHVALIAGVGPDTLALSAIKLTSALSSGDEESKKLSGSIRSLGLSTRDANGALVPMDQLFPSIVSKLASMDDVTQRNVLAADIFGKSWAEIAPVLALGADGIAGARTQAHELGVVLSGEALESADAFRLKIGILQAQIGALTANFGLAVVAISEFPAPVLAGVGAVLGLVAALGPALVVAGSLTRAYVTLTATFPALAGGFATIGAPIALAVLAFGAVVAAGTAVVQNWNVISFEVGRLVDAVGGAFGSLEKTGAKLWGELSDTVVSAVNAMADRLEWFTGPLTALGKSVGKMVTAVTGLFGDLGVFVVRKVTEISGAVASWLVDKLAPLGTWVNDRVIQPVVKGFGVLFEGVVAILTSLYNKFASIATSIANVVGAMVDKIREFLVGKFTAIVDGVKAQVDRVTGFFTKLSDVLVGHSIVPDMVDLIGGEFARMGEEMEGGTKTAVTHTEGAFGALTGKLSGILSGEKGRILGVLDGLVGDIGTKWAGVEQVLRNPFDSLKDWIDTTWVKGLKDAISGGLKDVGGAVISGLAGSAGATGQAIGSAIGSAIGTAIGSIFEIRALKEGFSFVAQTIINENEAMVRALASGWMPFNMHLAGILQNTEAIDAEVEATRGVEVAVRESTSMLALLLDAVSGGFGDLIAKDWTPTINVTVGAGGAAVATAGAFTSGGSGSGGFALDEALGGSLDL